MKLRIATRGSDLARTQASTIAEELHELGHETELVIVTTAGDQSDAPSFGSIGPTGVFVREIEQALLDDNADIAVHSFKDLPTESPEALTLAAVPRREDAADVLVMNRSAHDATAAASLPIESGRTVGTSAARRQAWLRSLRPDLDIRPVRGNVPTRLSKLADGYDGVVLAAAGLDRLRASSIDVPDLALDGYAVVRLDPEHFVPAPAQGALALQCRESDEDIVDVLSVIGHGPTETCVAVERALLMRVEGGCDLAFGAYCTEAPNGMLTLVAMLEREGRLVGAKAHDRDPHALVDIAWTTLADA